MAVILNIQQTTTNIHCVCKILWATLFLFFMRIWAACRKCFSGVYNNTVQPSNSNNTQRSHAGCSLKVKLSRKFLKRNYRKNIRTKQRHCHRNVIIPWIQIDCASSLIVLHKLAVEGSTWTILENFERTYSFKCKLIELYWTLYWSWNYLLRNQVFTYFYPHFRCTFPKLNYPQTILKRLVFEELWN